MEMERLRHADVFRKQKEERARNMVFILKMMKQEKFTEEEKQWAQKMSYINNLKDIEEFKRGMTCAMLEQKETKFKNWL